MENIFLTSSLQAVAGDLVKYFPKKTKKFLFIITASEVETGDLPWLKRDRDSMTDLGYELEDYTLTHKAEDEIAQKLSEFDGVVMGGGNTFYLLEKIFESGFDQALKQFIKQGKVYIGSSAGSYIMCPTIEAAKWKHLDDPNKASRTDLDALGYVDFLMIAHYSDKYRQAVLDGIKNTTRPVVVLTDQQALAVDGDKISLIGSQELLKFNGFEL